MKIVCIQSPYYDYLTATIIEGLQELGHEIIASENSNYATKNPDIKVKKAMESADLIIVFSNYDVRRYLVEDIKNPMIVYVDGSDSQDFSIPSNILFKAVFKRELHKFWEPIPNNLIFPMPFAIERRYINRSEKARDIPVSFAATLGTNTVRYSAYHALKALKIEGAWIGGTGERAYVGKGDSKGVPAPTGKYRNILERSMISINSIGGGYDCARYWEILASGAMLLTQDIEIQMPNSLVDGQHCVVFRNSEELVEKLNYYKSRPDEVDRISQAGSAYALSHHTTAKRAEYFLEKICFARTSDSFADYFFHGDEFPSSKIKWYLKKYTRTYYQRLIEGLS
jgi:hypothetical protein